jgi:hypothetical protein
MKKPTKTTKSNKTHGATHDVKTAQPTPPPARPTEHGLHPATPLEIMASRAIDQELDWYFSYAESALHRGRIGMVPTYVAVRVTDPTDAAVQSRAHEIARIVRGCLRGLAPQQAEVLRAVYTPRAWPRNVAKAWGSLSAIAVRLAFLDDPWPPRAGRSGLEHAAALRLSAALTSSSVSVAKLRNQAERLLAGAVVAYAGLRAGSL